MEEKTQTEKRQFTLEDVTKALNDSPDSHDDIPKEILDAAKKGDFDSVRKLCKFLVALTKIDIRKRLGLPDPTPLNQPTPEKKEEKSAEDLIRDHGITG